LKAGYVLLDGCGDRPDPRLNYTTPLEAAYTPNLDKIARDAKLGNVVTVGRGISPESDIAVFNMLGYSFEKGYPGRGVVEAVGAGLDIKDGDLALRANLASSNGRKIVDRRAGRNLTQEEADLIAEDVRRVKLKDAEFVFVPTISYRGILLIRASKPLSAKITNTDPAYQRVSGFGAAKETAPGERIAKCVPEEDSEPARRAAILVNEFTEKSLRVLDQSGVNNQRRREGKLPANCILLRDAGDHLPIVPTFEEKYGMKGTALVEMPAEVGIARLLKMKMVEIKDRDDMKEKATLFSSELRDGSLVYLHIKGPDIYGHDGDAVGKKKCIEQIDREFFADAVEGAKDALLGVSCDHATPCTLKMHSDDPVPLLITSIGEHDSMRFCERNAFRGSLGSLRGKDVLRTMLGTPKRN
jgi:2,3-bisphosphoglycerate-independent phosphoglycerate mutase